MADEPDTPSMDTKPAPRRRAPRKTEGTHAAPKPPARRKPGPKSMLEQVEDAAGDIVGAPVAAVTSTARKATEAVKPRSTNRATPRTPAKKDQTMSKQSPATTPDKVGRGWGAAAVAGGLGAAATIALLTLRGSSRRAKPIAVPQSAHQPDGTDSSASFAAGIADENTVPGVEDAPALAAQTGTAHQADGSDSTASFEAGIADEGTIPG